MTKRTVANNFLYYIFCGFSGAVTSLIVWLFLKLMGLGICLVWDTIPSNFDFKFYPIIVCTAGGIILGIWQKLTNAVPDELDEVMKKVKKDKFYPYNKVLLLCISALLPLVFGGSMGLPRLGGYNITNFERLWGIPLALLGAVCGFLFIISSKIFGKFFALIQGKLGIIISTTLGGIILGVMGTYLPLTMFSGEESITVVKESFAEFAPWILIISGVLKLVLTNICIKSGWKGGHFFPVIFCGVSIGYGVAMLGGLDTAFCAAVVTAGLLGVTMKKPLAVTMLLLLCFDARVIPWILLAAFLGSIIPTKIFGNNKKKAK